MKLELETFYVHYDFIQVPTEVLYDGQNDHLLAFMEGTGRWKYLIESK